MIAIKVVLDTSELLKSCDIRGHGGAGKSGSDIVCAAVSVLARTAQAVLAKREGIITKSTASRRGEFTLETEAQSKTGEDFLLAAGTFLIEGLAGVAEEYPENCSMTITKERRN